MIFQMNIEDIHNNGNLTIAEKLEQLNSLKLSYNELIEHTKETITKDYHYCEKCKDWYKRKAYDIGVRHRKELRCTNPLTGGYLDDYEYEEIIVEEMYHECPKGHQEGGLL